ncbi:MAG: sigma-70 family RNA polymerase sigma factor [Myxococcales bacterium]|nr:sigma-70 family RNA polymerase sigma factor [Myxococcales bacterium]
MIDDVELMFAVASGKRDALGVLYDRYGSTLLAIGVRILQDTRAAEDLLHDVFLELWQRAADYDPSRGSVRAWLCIRMRCRALDRRKSVGFSRVSLMTDQMQDTLEARVDTQDVSAVDHARLTSALNQLSAEQRRVLELGYFEGLSSTEIASVLNIPVGTVKSRVAAGRAALKQRFLEVAGERG